MSFGVVFILVVKNVIIGTICTCDFTMTGATITSLK